MNIVIKPIKHIHHVVQIYIDERSISLFSHEESKLVHALNIWAGNMEFVGVKKVQTIIQSVILR